MASRKSSSFCSGHEPQNKWKCVKTRLHTLFEEEIIKAGYLGTTTRTLTSLNEEGDLC